jgi:hypothetical protein
MAHIEYILLFLFSQMKTIDTLDAYIKFGAN